LFIVIYYNIFQFFLQKRYSEADFVMKVSRKIALYNVVFHQLPLPPLPIVYIEPPPYPGFSKRIEVGVSIYKVGRELSAGGTNRAPLAQVGESPRGGFPPSLIGGGYGGSPPENFEILDCRRCILSIFCH
jgi:hypothetical protein